MEVIGIAQGQMVVVWLPLQHTLVRFHKVGIESPLLCMHGGGGAARSSAVAWAQNDGKIWSSGGRRALGNRGPWAGHLIEGDAVIDHVGKRLLIDFDLNPVNPFPLHQYRQIYTSFLIPFRGG